MIPKLEKALEFYPRATWAICNKALAHYFSGDDEKAEFEYKRAATINPNFRMAHIMLGEMYSLQRKMPEAEEAFRRAVQAEPTVKVGTGQAT